jgi:hypothetical protein
VRQLCPSPFVVRGLSLCLVMILATPARPQNPRADDSLPVLYGIKLDGARVAIDVVSSGCTDASHFSVRLDPELPDAYRLSVIRHRQDRCRMGAHIVTLTLDIPAVPNPPGADFLLMNRLATSVTLRRSDP